jgi:YVTN family beta-propeller protein
MLDFRILGPLHVLDDDRTIGLGGARQRAVLAILLLHRGETVSVDRIADLLWGERPPATAVKTVQVYVSHLRRALVDDVVVSTRGGYALQVAAEQVDAGRFARLVDEGREALAEDDAERASELVGAGLALWRGPPLADLAYEGFVQDAVARLDEQRLEALELRVEADLRLGRHAELVPELEGLVREHPTRERLRAQHMLALYRSGRQADALDSFRDARRALIDELGLEPGRELRELEQGVLAQDPSLDAPRAPARGSRPVRRRGVALIAVGVVLAAAVVGVTVALSRSSEDVAVLPDSVAVIDPESDLVVADVQVGVRPETIVADDGSLWVANVADGTVMQIDMAKRRVVATIAPDDVDVNALAVGDGSAWIADARRGVAVRVDADLGSVADSVPLPTPNGTGIAFGTRRAALVSDGALWVTSSPLAEVLRVDTRTRRVAGRVDVGNEPSGLVAADGAIWVADSIDNNVHRIVPTAAGAVTDTIPLGNGPGPIAAGEGAIWVANMRDDTVSRIDPVTRSAEAEIEVGRQPTGVAVGADAVWVANSLSGTVSRIDPGTNRVTKTIAVGGAPHSVAFAGDRVWVSVQEAAPPPVPVGGPSTVRLLVERDPVITDPFRLEHTELQHATCGRLMTYESSGGAGELVPELAAAPPAVSDGGRTYTFVIRDGYRFSPPSGEPVTAAAFERAIERGVDTDLVNDIRGVAAYRAGRARTINGVSARGNQLTIRLKRPWPRLAPSLGTLYFCAVPPDTPARPRGIERIATAGPYYVAEAAPGKRLVLRRNPGYPGPRPQGPEAIEVTIGVAPDRAVADVEAGRADYFQRVPRTEQARLAARYGPGSPAAAAGGQRYFTGAWPGVQGYTFNPRRPLFADADMRRAVNYAIDRRALTEHPIPEALAGRPTDQSIPPGWPGYRDVAIYPLGGPDLAEARRLAGPGRHRGVFYTCNAPECIEQAEIVRQNLTAIGIDLEIRRFPFGTMFARIQKPDEPFDISMSGWIGDTPDPSEFMDIMMGGLLIAAAVDESPAGARLRAAAQATGAERIDTYAALDGEIAAEEAPFAQVMNNTRTDFFSARIGCQVEHPLYGIDLAALCLRD